MHLLKFLTGSVVWHIYIYVCERRMWISRLAFVLCNDDLDSKDGSVFRPGCILNLRFNCLFLVTRSFQHSWQSDHLSELRALGYREVNYRRALLKDIHNVSLRNLYRIKHTSEDTCVLSMLRDIGVKLQFLRTDIIKNSEENRCK